MDHAIPSRMQQWVAALDVAQLPVLTRTVTELAALREREEGITTRHVADVVLHDPIMTVKVLQYLGQHRTRRQSQDITTIANALMMLGLSPFFAHFSEQITLAERLAGKGLALEGALAVARRARRAALYALDWARLRFDVNPEEVMVAALLHDLAEIMLWCHAPELALEIRARQRRDRTLRSDAVQLRVLGFRLIDLQLELVRAWDLPELLHTLLDASHAANSRVVNVALATALARHASNGWDDSALPHDYRALCRFLNMPYRAVMQRVADLAVDGSAEAVWYEPATHGEPAPGPDAQVSEGSSD
jgi:HD-like signal output (HDOD) protein